MTVRQAKKVLRRRYVEHVAYRWPTQIRAAQANWRAKRRLWGRFTSGWRCGRWDPSEPRNPMEIPF
mgnify:CR=1 FL=1